MKDLNKKDISNISNPSSRNFSGVITEAKNICEWRHNLPKFFKDITGYSPYPYQAKFLKKMEDLSREYAIISAGRGTGKSKSLAVLALWYIFVLPLTDPGVPMKVVILAGSEKQARIVYNYITDFIGGILFLQKALAKDPTRDEILFTDGSWIRPLTASEKSIRGPHPDLLVIDEACEAREDLLKAAFPMIGTSKYPRLILSSTPDKYFSLFVDVYSKRKSYPQFLRFNWSALDCPLISKGFLKSQKSLLDVGNYQVEYLGLPYSFVGKVFPLKKLRDCVKYRGLIAGDGIKYAGCDWGHYPAPTVLTITEKVEDKKNKRWIWRVLYTQSYLKQNFKDVLDKIELIANSYQISAIYTDSNDIGENQRLSGRGLPVYPVKFKSQKAAMISNLRALVENELIQIDGAKDYPLVAQMRDYRYDTKRNDDYVDCYDPQTEVLTKKGWKKISNISFKDEIATLKNSYLTYEKPTNLIEENFKGKAVELTGRKLDLLITPRHKLYAAISKGANTYQSFKLIRARNLLGKYFQVKKTAKWKGRRQKFHVIPGLVEERDFTFWKVKEKMIPMSLWLRFLGYYLSEGNTTLNKISIAQKEGHKKEIMRKLLRELPFNLEENPNEFYIYSKQLAEHLKSLGKSYSKFVPLEILELSSEYLIYLLEALMLCDGSRNHYYTVSKRLADNVQEISLKVGLSAEVRTLREKNIGYIKERKIRGERIYSVDIHAKGEPKVNNSLRKRNASKLTEVPYDGKMYCLTVPSHIIYVRRNGHPVWSGNSLMLAVKGGRQILPLKWNLKDFIVIKKRRPRIGSPFGLKHQMSERYEKPKELITEEERKIWKALKEKKERKE